MMPSRPSTASRRALHERSPSHTNESPPSSTPSSLRLVRSKSDHHSNPDQENEHDVYSSTPYPTKPEHILLPSPGKGQHQQPQSQQPPEQQHQDEPSQSTGTLSTLLSADPSHLADSSGLDQSGSDSWVNLVASSQSWLNDPDSSRSSFPQQTDTENNEGDQDDKTVSSDEMNLPTVPTVKPVVSEPPSRHQSVYHGSDPGSSPNVMPIGPPSSPNFVALDNSSLNFVPLGTSSNPGSVTHRSNSMSSSAHSFGTVIRHVGAAPWTHGSSSEHSSWAARSFHSTPPYQSATGSAHSSHPSSHERNRSRSIRSHSRSYTSSSRRSGPSSSQGPGSDIQAVVDSGVYVQYPIIQAPSSSGGSWADTSNEPGPSDQSHFNLQEPIPERSDSRITSHLSTVPSQWSAECDNSFADEPSTERLQPARPATALGVRGSDPSSLWMINDSDERLDNITSLPMRNVSSRRASTPSASRSSSMRSIQRPGTSSSFMTNFLPTWAKVYYQQGQAVNSAVSFMDASRPSSARQPAADIQRPPTAAGRPKTRRGLPEPESENNEDEDPRDPRSHWVTPEPEEQPQTGSYHLRHSWSPHLYPDRQEIAERSTAWIAPSMDSRTEPLLGRRNVQVWSFCFGFIFPIAWFVAALLPLPPKPDLDLEASVPENEVALQARLYDLERRRYDNARWWRNLNRWMVPFGFVVIIIVVCPLSPFIHLCIVHGNLLTCDRSFWLL